MLVSVAPPLALPVLGLQFCIHRSALEQKGPNSSETQHSPTRPPDQTAGAEAHLLPIASQSQCG